MLQPFGFNFLIQDLNEISGNLNCKLEAMFSASCYRTILAWYPSCDFYNSRKILITIDIVNANIHINILDIADKIYCISNGTRRLNNHRQNSEFFFGIKSEGVVDSRNLTFLTICCEDTFNRRVDILYYFHKMFVDTRATRDNASACMMQVLSLFLFSHGLVHFEKIDSNLLIPFNLVD